MQTTDELATIGRIAIAIKNYSKHLADYPGLNRLETMSAYLQQKLTAQDWVYFQLLAVESTPNN